MIEERNTRNSQFDNVLENFKSENDYNAVPEEGAIIYSDERIYYANGNEFLQIANSSEIPFSGYQVVQDDEHINFSTAQSLTAVEQVIENNEGILLGTLNEFNNNKFYFQNGVLYTISISFAYQTTSVNTHANIFFGTSGIPYNGYSNVVNFPLQANAPHLFTQTFQILGDESTENGIELYIYPSATAKLWDARFTISRAF